jgi:hypothetical protein
MPNSVGDVTSYRPELRGHDWSPVLVWLLRRGLSAEPCPVATPLPEQSWAALLEVVQRDRITGHLVAGIDAGLPVTPRQEEQARRAHRLAVTTDTVIEHVLVGLAELLDSEVIRWRVIKGVVAARTLYPDPALRSTGDVDVLVHPTDFSRAIDLIRAKGDVRWERAFPGRAAERVAHARTFLHRTNTELDVHREVRGHAGRYRLPAEALFVEHSTIDIMGQDLPVPPLQVIILHAMLNLSKGEPTSLGRLSTLADLLWARVAHPEAYDDACALAVQLGCATPAAWADRVAEEWCSDLGRRAPISRDRNSASRLRLWAFDRAVGSRFVAGHLPRVVGPHRLRRVWEAAFPTAEFRARHGLTARAQLKHIVMSLLRGSDAPPC